MFIIKEKGHKCERTESSDRMWELTIARISGKKNNSLKFLWAPKLENLTLGYFSTTLPFLRFLQWQKPNITVRSSITWTLQISSIVVLMTSESQCWHLEILWGFQQQSSKIWLKQSQNPFINFKLTKNEESYLTTKIVKDFACQIQHFVVRFWHWTGRLLCAFLSYLFFFFFQCIWKKVICSLSPLLLTIVDVVNRICTQRFGIC